MIRSFVYISEVLCNRVVHIMLLCEDLDVTSLIYPLYLGHHRVAPLDLEHFVGNLVELLHVASPEQVGEVLYVFEFVELLSYG